MNTLRTLKQTYHINENLFIDTIEIIQTGLYYTLTQQQLLEYTVENCTINQYKTTYNTFTEFVKELIHYLQTQKLLQYHEFSEYIEILCGMYKAYTL